MKVIVKIKNPTSDDILSFQFAAYLNVAFRRCRIRHWKKTLRAKPVSIDGEEINHKTKIALSSCDKTLTNILDEISDNPVIVKAIKALSVREKQILKLHIFDKYSFAEIAELLNIKYTKIIYTFSKMKRELQRGAISGFQG